MPDADDTIERNFSYGHNVLEINMVKINHSHTT